MQRFQKPWILSLIMLVLTIGAPIARADTPFEVGNNILVDAATATVARQGETSRIRFRVVNGSTATFHLLGLDTAVSRGARLIADVGKAERTILESIGIPAGETLNLTTSRDLEAGEVFDMTLLFVGGQLTVPVHVHDAPPGR